VSLLVRVVYGGSDDSTFNKEGLETKSSDTIGDLHPLMDSLHSRWKYESKETFVKSMAFYPIVVDLLLSLSSSQPKRSAYVQNKHTHHMENNEMEEECSEVAKVNSMFTPFRTSVIVWRVNIMADPFSGREKERGSEGGGRKGEEEQLVLQNNHFQVIDMMCRFLEMVLQTEILSHLFIILNTMASGQVSSWYGC
jgi:hypothetical protein